MRNTDEIEDQELALPVKRNMKLKLKSAVPSGYPITKMKRQLDDLGLNCSETTEENLANMKKDVTSSFRVGSKQIFSLLKTEGAGPQRLKGFYNGDGEFLSLRGEAFFRALGAENMDETGSWVIEDDAGGYREELSTIVFPDHFDKLYKDHDGVFNGAKREETKIIPEPTGQVIRDTFRSMAQVVNSVSPGGIAPQDLETMISIILGNNQSSNPKDYMMDNCLYVFMVNGYDGETGTAISVGGLSISYRIFIKDYTSKSDNKSGRHNDADIYLAARFASYSDIAVMQRDLSWIKQKCTMLFAADEQAQLQENGMVSIFQDIPVTKSAIKIYERRPLPGQDVFKKGLPVVATGHYQDSIIFYCPDFESLGYFDNSQSDATTTYEKSVTVGFENSIGTTISMETSMEMDAIIAKFGFKLGISMSMSSSFNHSQTETVSISVDGRKSSYLYQGKMMSVTLRYFPETFTYQYIDSTENVFLTNAVKTTEAPIIDPAIFKKMMEG